MENVRGILEEQNKKSLDMFLTQLSDCGYKVKYELLNAADYKIPQDSIMMFMLDHTTVNICPTRWRN